MSIGGSKIFFWGNIGQAPGSILIRGGGFLENQIARQIPYAIALAFMGVEPNHADDGQYAGVTLFRDEERAGLAFARCYLSTLPPDPFRARMDERAADA
jgi:hypothetical protein